MTDKQRFSSVWDAIEDTPQNAASMRARSGLMMSLTEVIRQQGMTQAQAAVFFGVTQPRISDLMRGKVNLFSLDTLIDMAAAAGMGPTVKVSMPRAAPAKRPARRVAAHVCPFSPQLGRAAILPKSRFLPLACWGSEQGSSVREGCDAAPHL